MAEILLKIGISGENGLDADLNEFLTGEFKSVMAKALKDVRNDMRAALSEHVRRDVYEAYKNPVEYERRGMNGGLQGQALEATSHAEALDLTGRNYSMYIAFRPNGNHPDEYEWRQDGVVAVHGDDLIGRIERWNPKYSYPPHHRRLPRRPFWLNFVNEMVDDGMIEHYFANAMRRQGVEIIEDGNVIREPNDGDF